MLKINASKCIGCGLCVDLCPTVFRLNSSGQAEVFGNELSGDNEEVKSAAQSCPAEAIILK
ncbi:ferredoxin [Candidatus Falkowbacteria bacterium]|uniref:Ferredoxin n=1 Tax=Candidatus Falkowbacteria bacterium CG10_big_fil_rev_8_21_14_0_10_37_18 TaxID=1974562 RepID=A0A2H0VBF2_9BACT|nr:ferredoxin [Candidatus Falkowbacteria bacterium]NCQ12484.1 ferredoxin [Candidatus Falkowbacteria bacterium]OIO06085.1 MAG: hypothetical protein AUJ26_01620 [Candidatus Falkowbacteria bacterium CG1_02_37_21]PIR95679.1 MAG: ferredoxin [Candidatus Falkowbacteria bacterium CG10_big_fil_rev_8_21_14_0_10_37_18]